MPGRCNSHLVYHSGTYLLKGPATDLDARAMLIEQHSPPEIVLHGLVTPEDVDRLFEM